eukprot:1910821-Pyramimonas_sp.AAC.1
MEVEDSYAGYLTDGGLNVALAPLASLTRLDLRYCKEVTDNVLIGLTHTLRNLLSLNMEDSPMGRKFGDMERDHAGSNTWRGNILPDRPLCRPPWTLPLWTLFLYWYLFIHKL